MGFFKTKIAFGLVLAVLIFPVAADRGLSRDQYVYDNLMRSRDGLLGQREELQRAYSDTSSQIDRLKAKLDRYDAYLKQIDDSLRDVNSALDQLR